MKHKPEYEIIKTRYDIERERIKERLDSECPECHYADIWNGITALIATFVSCFFDKEDDDLVFKIVYIISLFFWVYITYCYWIHIG